MGSGFEPIPVPSQRHDPAWNHCQMFRDGDRVQLKCQYCSKTFKGGGIHRIKEHLACQKGNASTCLRVPPEVRASMQRSLDGVVAKKRNRQKLDEELTSLSPATEPPKSLTTNALIGAYESTPTGDGESLGVVEREVRSTGGRFGGERGKRGRGRGGRHSSSMTRDVVIGVTNSSYPNNSVGVDVGVGLNLVVVPKKVGVNDDLHKAIGRFLYDIGAPMDSVDSPFFQPMIEAVTSRGSGAVLPSRHDIRGWILKNSLDEVRSDVDSHRGSWERNGCSVLVDEVSTEADRVFLCFYVNCPAGTVFLKTAEVIDIVGSSDAVYKSIKEVVEEVGPANILQVITSGYKDSYVAAGKKLSETFPNLYWAPCALRLIDAILEDFANIEWISEVIDQARSITRFVYNHAEILNISRRYTRCDDIVEPGPTRSATNFTTLKRLVDLKHDFHTMVTSQEWVDCPYSKKPGGLDMMDSVSHESFWSSCTVVVNITSSLLRALRIVGNSKKPSVGYVYAALYRAKEMIKKELVKKEEYAVFWEIIDQRWEYLRNYPLHSAGFYLNPKFFYSIEGDIHNDILSGVFDCIERLIPDTNVQDNIVKEINLYKNAARDFGRKMAIRTKDTLLPAEWWSAYGGGCPNLSRLAIRILSQMCCVVGCNNRNQDLVQKMHDTGNSLEHQRLSDLIFVHNNLGLKKMAIKSNGQDSNRVVEEWVKPLEDDIGDSDWTAIDPPPSATMTVVAHTDEDSEDLGTGFEDYDIFSRVKDGEDENLQDRVPLK